MSKLSALCNKCGWYGSAEPGLNFIPHDGCSYSAAYSRTEFKLHDLMETVKSIIERAENQAETIVGGCRMVAIPFSEIRALRSALSRMQGGGNGNG